MYMYISIYHHILSYIYISTYVNNYLYMYIYPQLISPFNNTSPEFPVFVVQVQLRGHHCNGRGRREAELRGIELEETEVVHRVTVDLGALGGWILGW